MANVLSKGTPRVYLESVNTPDYSTIDWIINPNLDNVIGVPVHYYNVDIVPEVPEVAEVLDVDGITVLVPYSPAIPESVTVSEMTLEQKDAYDATVPAVQNYNKLSNGMPAFYDNDRNIVRSINEREIVFFTKTSGSKNFFLNTDGLIASNVKGFTIVNNNTIVMATVTIQTAVSTNTTFEFVLNGTNVVLCQVVIPAGYTTFSDSSLHLSCSQNSEIACRVVCSDFVINPLARLALSYTN